METAHATQLLAAHAPFSASPSAAPAAFAAALAGGIHQCTALARAREMDLHLLPRVPRVHKYILVSALLR